MVGKRPGRVGVGVKGKRMGKGVGGGRKGRGEGAAMIEKWKHMLCYPSSLRRLTGIFPLFKKNYCYFLCYLLSRIHLPGKAGFVSAKGNCINGYRVVQEILRRAPDKIDQDCQKPRKT